MEHLLQACLALTSRLLPSMFPRRYARRPPSGLAGVALFFFVVVGVPSLAVLWGYLTGRLPAPSPYSD
jgi:hypothetical protein